MQSGGILFEPTRNLKLELGLVLNSSDIADFERVLFPRPPDLAIITRSKVVTQSRKKRRKGARVGF
jgi:hypothetical protein